MKIYIRKIDSQFISHQVSYPKYVLESFFDGKQNNDTILCEGRSSHHEEIVTILTSTDTRLNNNIYKVLSAEGNYEIGDLMVMYKKRDRYLVELIKRDDSRFDVLEKMFAENDRHLLADMDDKQADSEENDKIEKFKKLLGWFVKQLNINNGIEPGNKVVGYGYRENSSIREEYKEWRDYGDFTLDCTLGRGYQSIFSGSNYINKTGTGINIRPIFDKNTKKIEDLKISLYGYEDYDLTQEMIDILNKTYNVDALMLYDGADANDLLKELFKDYCRIIEILLGKSPSSLPIAGTRTRTRYDLNRIIYGAPGTGKTYSTAMYAIAVVEDKPLSDYNNILRTDLMCKFNDYINNGQIVFTTFHQNYGYEEFIQGIRPDVNSGDVNFKTRDGIFKKLAKVALDNQDKDYVIIIDEINRANISKVFGELITLIEPDKRWGEINCFPAILPSGEKFVVPNNLYILGTMNSADKSIAMVDTALRRRFKFIEMPPKSVLVNDSKLKDIFVKINQKLRDKLGSSDLLIGHAYFIGKTERDIKEIFNDSVIPLLYEYYFGDEEEVFETVNHALNGTGLHATKYSGGNEIKRVRVE